MFQVSHSSLAIVINQEFDDMDSMKNSYLVKLKVHIKHVKVQLFLMVRVSEFYLILNSVPLCYDIP